VLHYTVHSNNLETIFSLENTKDNNSPKLVE
jgi:hypothetical protein